jgi:hypothetical protein
MSRLQTTEGNRPTTIFRLVALSVPICLLPSQKLTTSSQNSLEKTLAAQQHANEPALVGAHIKGSSGTRQPELPSQGTNKGMSMGAPSGSNCMVLSPGMTFVFGFLL